MSPKFQKEAILEGLIDSFCLVCEDHLKSADEVALHIAKPVHRKNLNAAQYVTRYNQILRVKHGYFCIPCGTFLPTLSAAALHIKEKEHYRSEAIQQIERVGDYVSINGLLIDYKAWNGLMGNSCAVCNMEVACQDLHKSQPSHIMNLINTTVEFAADRHEIYRKVDKNSFHCIICNEIYSLHDLPSHFGESDHNKKLNYCRLKYFQHNVNVKQNKMKLSCSCFEQSRPTEIFKSNREVQHQQYANNSSSSEGFDSDYPSDEPIDISPTDEQHDNRQPTILDFVTTFEKNDVNINFENETAFCKKCSVVVDFNYEAILKHIKEHDKSPKKRNVSYVPFPCEVNMARNIRSGIEQTNTPSICSNDAIADLKEDIHSGKSVSEKEIDAERKGSSTQNDGKQTSSEDPAAYASENQLKYEADNRNVYCLICNVMIPTSLASMKEHVSGTIHKKLATKYKATSMADSERVHVQAKGHKKLPKKYNVIPMGDFVDELITVKSHFGIVKVINGKYCISEQSFFLITKIGHRLRCQACEVNMSPTEMMWHQESWGHHILEVRIPVVTSLDKTEFVREVRPGIFHCGYCNLITAPWTELQNHLISDEHKTVKQKYDIRLIHLKIKYVF